MKIPNPKKLFILELIQLAAVRCLLMKMEFQFGLIKNLKNIPQQ